MPIGTLSQIGQQSGDRNMLSCQYCLEMMDYVNSMLMLNKSNMSESMQILKENTNCLSSFTVSLRDLDTYKE